MNPFSPFARNDQAMIDIRCGLEFTYYTPAATPVLLLIAPRLEPGQILYHETLQFSNNYAVMNLDSHGNVVHRIMMPAGQFTIRHDFFVSMPAVPENFHAVDGAIPAHDLPIEMLRYVMPSRYCDSDTLSDFANSTFGHIAPGLGLVQAICNWVHNNIAYRWGSGSPFTTASQIINQRFGVCRDFAHVAVALCRCFNIPARYTTGYVPDIAYEDNGSPMDFHAYFQVYLGGRWQTFDARFNTPRIGRVHIAVGLDAVDGAFATLFGPAVMTWFSVWAYQIDPYEVRPGDPVDLTKRLCGTTTLRFPMPPQNPGMR
ncbi:MAG TPA: transglutaminase family protein [Chthoniobacterales bacterium]